MALKLRDYITTSERRKAIECELQISLAKIAQVPFDETQASTRNCENMIGGVSVPVGIAGPLLVKSVEREVERYYLPLATTEGALVASVNRGCKAITESGGVTVISKKIGITRAPVFIVKNIEEGAQFVKNIEEHFQNFKVIAEKTSSHLTLLHIRPWMVGKNVFLRFSYDSEDAMGMNMATIATSAVVKHIEEKTGLPCVSLSGNLCVDKKSNFLNFIEGRGISVWADVTIPKEIVSLILKTTPQKIVETAKRKLVYGSLLSGSIGANAQYANILAALFLATGQDMAHVAECSMGVTEIEEVDGDIYASIYLPDLVIGTVGGGTQLATQQESLSILHISGGDHGKNAIKLAQVIGAAVLAGEISLLASLSENTLAESHKKLGRGEK